MGSVLVELGRDAGELFIEGGAQPVDHCDDRHRNAGCDQAVFDGGRARFVFDELNEFTHVNSCSVASCENYAMGLMIE